MNGYGDRTFSPGNDLSRAMLAEILYNAKGRSGVTGNSPFTDVSSIAWYKNSVTQLAANGIAGGYGDGLYGSNDSITRE